MTHQEKVIQLEAVYQTFELATVAFDAVAVGMLGEASRSASSDRLDVEYRQVQLDFRHFEIGPIDAGAARMHDAKWALSGDMIMLFDTVDADAVATERKCVNDGHDSILL
jgi:hypothetical protein